MSGKTSMSGKIVKILVGVVIFVLALMFSLPLFFSDKVKDVAVNEVNNMLDADVYVGDFSMSFFSNFPDASITFKDFGVIGRGDFEGDTLADVKELTAAFDVMSLLSDKYQIKKVILTDANVRAKVNENGKANWDIMVSDSTVTEDTVDEDTSSSAFNLALDRIIIERLSASYLDKQSGMQANVDSLNLNLVGDVALDVKTLCDIKGLDMTIGRVRYSDTSDVAADVRDLSLKFDGKVSDAVSDINAVLKSAGVTVSLDGIPYLKNTVLDANVDMQADLDNMKFTLGENSIKLNEVGLKFSGWAQMTDTIIDMDVNLSAPGIQLKDVLSLVPQIYTNDFKGLSAKGEVSLDAVAKGRVVGDTLPAIDLAFKVKDGYFKYADLPKAAENINIDVKVNSTQGTADNIVVDVNNFSATMAGNPISLSLNLKTPVSDMDFVAKANGKIDFSSLSQIVPLGDLKLGGSATANLAAAGRMSYIDNEQYDKCSVNGHLGINGMKVSMSGLDYDVNISDAKMNFTTQNVDVDAQIGIGKSDVSAKGKLQNYMGYILRGSTIKGQLDVNSNLIDCNELLGKTPDDGTDDTDAEEPTTGEPLSIPSNIDFALNVGVKKVLYDKIDINDIIANASMANSVIQIKKLSASALGGSFNAQGKLDGKDSLRPYIDVPELSISKMSLSEVFTKVKTARKIAPIFSDAKGDFTASMSLNTVIDGKTLSPVLNTVNAKGRFKSGDIQLTTVKALNEVAKLTKQDALSNPKLKDINIGFKIENGKLEIDPFETLISNISVGMSGWSGLDQTLGYVANIKLPQSLMKNAPAIFQNASVAVNIGGTFKNPKVTLGTSAISTVKDVAKQALDSVKTVAKEKIDEVKQKLIAEAKAQKEKLVAEAMKNGEKLVSEAEYQSNKLQKDCKNPLEKAAKKKAGEALVSQAKKDSTKLVNTAITQGDKLIRDAESK